MQNIILCDGLRLEDVALLCREYGYGIEAQSFYDPEFLNTEPDPITRHLAAMKGISPKVVHGPFGDLNAGSFDRMVRDLAEQRFDLGYDIAAKLNADHLILHLGYVPRTSPIQHWIKRCAEFWRDFLAAHDTEIAIHLENVLELGPEVVGDAIDEIGSERVDVCLDIGHAHANSTTPVVNWIEHLKDAIGYVHIHDNHGDGDEHLAIGRGNLPVAEVCEALNEWSPNAIWAIEVLGDGIEESLGWLGSRGYLRLSRTNERREP